MAETQIEWTDSTWNPVAGCSIITAGCTHCYAMEMAKRLEAMGIEKYAGLTRKTGKRTVWNGVVREDREALSIPYGWKKPRKIFVNSMSDLCSSAARLRSDTLTIVVLSCVMKAPATVTAMIFQMPGPSRSDSPPPPGVEPSLLVSCAAHDVHNAILQNWGVGRAGLNAPGGPEWRPGSVRPPAQYARALHRSR
jgi:hypothetical protein